MNEPLHNVATVIADAAEALADRIGCCDLPDALRWIAEQGPRTYPEEVLIEALTVAADAIEEATRELAVTLRCSAIREGNGAQ